MEEVNIYIKIVGFIVPLLIALFTWIVIQHFSVRERVKILEVELVNNGEADKQNKADSTNIWDAIKDMNDTLSKFGADIQVMGERVNLLLKDRDRK